MIETALDGWAARIEAPAPSPFLVGPESYTHAFGMIDGRPVVLRFNYSYRQQDLPTTTQLAVMDSFATRVAQAAVPGIAWLVPRCPVLVEEVGDLVRPLLLHDPQLHLE